MVYLDVADTPGSALANAIAREVAGRVFKVSHRLGEIFLPGASGREVLQILSRRLAEQGKAVTVALDNVHQLLADDLMGLGLQSADRGIPHAGAMLSWFFLMVSLPLIIIAAIDVPWQLYSFHKEMRMSRQEVRDEQKETDGRPEVKSKLREMQQAAAQRRMMEEVPKADVVITNPTHYAVALRYDEARASAPVVVAKGAELIAARIREIASENDVPLVESPRLARAVFASTDLGDEIPAGLYLAVAQILAYVYQLRDWQVQGGEFPEPPEPDVDDEFLQGLAP